MDGAGEMAENRKQGWPVGGWALLGDRLCRIQFWLLLAGTLFNGCRIRRGDSSRDCQDGVAPPGAVNGKGCRPSIINTHQQKLREKGTSDPSWSASAVSPIFVFVPRLSISRRGVVCLDKAARQSPWN